MVRACSPPEREPASSWPARRSTMATSTPANANSPASISPVGPPPAITTACSVIATLRSASGHRLLRKPGGLEGLCRVAVGVDMNDLSLAKRPGVGERALELYAGVPGLQPHSVDRDKALTGTDDALQFDIDAFEGRKPLFRRPGEALVAVVRLARVIGQEIVLKGNFGIDEGQITCRLAPLPGLN